MVIEVLCEEATVNEIAAKYSIHSAMLGRWKKEFLERASDVFNRAWNDYKYNSDIDLAIYCEGKLPSGLWLDLDEAVGIYKIDLVDMNSLLDEKLRQCVEEQGVDIYRRGTRERWSICR